jgi:hypothetical protein
MDALMTRYTLGSSTRRESTNQTVVPLPYCPEDRSTLWNWLLLRNSALVQNNIGDNGMLIDRKAPLSPLVSVVLLTYTSAVLLCACASIQGYPVDPEATDKTLINLAPYYDGTEEKRYEALGADSDARTQKRNEIVFARMRGYDIEFANFERQLYGFSNTVTIGTDLMGLTLGGLTATVGSAATKAALGAASVGVLGANTAINKDLYFQKTIPALIAQMEANRAKKQLAIVQGLAQPDSKYSLMAAYSDLDAYKSAGSIPDAIGSITQDASNAKQSAISDITFTRTHLDVTQLPDKKEIQAQVKTLTDLQTSALAKAMQPNLATRPPEIQQLVKTLDANDNRLNGNAVAARNVISAWIGEEDMTAVNKKQWADSIISVTK